METLNCLYYVLEILYVLYFLKLLINTILVALGVKWIIDGPKNEKIFMIYSNYF